MPKLPVRCFVSYCHHDIDHDALDFLVSTLSEYCRPSCTILTDKDLRPGDNIRDFEELLNTVDAVLVLLTPEYRSRVIAHQPGGVSREYTRICARREGYQQQKLDGKRPWEIEGYFDVIPVLMGGTKDSAVPPELVDVFYLELVSMRPIRKGAPDRSILPDAQEKKFLPLLRQLADRLQAIHTLKTAGYEDRYIEYYGRLFLETKADWANPRDSAHEYVSTLFVKTNAYRQVKAQRTHFIVGRKGSGKSTVTDVLAIEGRDEYKGHVALLADSFKLSVPYTFFDLPRIRADARHHFPRHACFDLGWEGLIVLACMCLLVERDRQGRLRPEQSEHIPKIQKLIARILDSDARPDEVENLYTILFTHVFEQVPLFIDDCITAARPLPDLFHTDIERRFSRKHYLRFVCGEAYDAFVSILELCTQHFLITLDGFDTAFDMFRRDSEVTGIAEDISKRAAFEIDWLRALLRLIVRARREAAKDGTYRLLDFCVTVPQDRFDEVLRTERDADAYSGKYCLITWSGIELAILVRKRLEELGQVTTNHSQTVEQRLHEAHQRALKGVPETVEFEFNGRRVSMPLFMYVLRHTFWRPRDVLICYARIIAAGEELRPIGYSLSSEVVRRIISECTTEIVIEEFINELKSTVLNIEEILQAFRGAGQLLAGREVAERVEGVDFRFAVGSSSGMDFRRKLEFLYSLGVLGISADRRTRELIGARSEHVFYFNEGFAPMRQLSAAPSLDTKYLLHPVFAEHLQLLPPPGEPTLQFTWPYLHEMEPVLHAQFPSLRA